MDNLQTQVASYIARLREPDRESAYHSLIEADDAVIPILIEAFRVEQDSIIRSQLVEVIWQHRFPQTIGFLAEALNDHAPEVWKNALDGLVTLGGQTAIEALEVAKREACSHTESGRAEWIGEAIEQIKEQTA